MSALGPDDMLRGRAAPTCGAIHFATGHGRARGTTAEENAPGRRFRPRRASPSALAVYVWRARIATYTLAVWPHRWRRASSDRRARPGEIDPPAYTNRALTAWRRSRSQADRSIIRSLLRRRSTTVRLDAGRLTRAQDAHIRMRGDPGRVGGETIAGFIERATPDMVKACRVQRSPVDRNHDGRARIGQDLRRGPRAEVSWTEVGTPGPDRKEGDVGGANQIAHGRKRARVSREVDARAGLEHVPDRLRTRGTG